MRRDPAVDGPLDDAEERGDILLSPALRDPSDRKTATRLEFRSRSRLLIPRSQRRSGTAGRPEIGSLRVNNQPARRALLHRLAGLLADHASRATPEVPSEVALMNAEVEIPDRLAAARGRPPDRRSPITWRRSRDLGYLARAKDPPAVTMTLWRGLTQLMDIQPGFEWSSRDLHH
jgi:hypothetical protein